MKKRYILCLVAGILIGATLFGGIFAFAASVNVEVSNWKFYVDGFAKSLSDYVIGGNNYLKFRDALEIADIGVWFDGEKREVYIETDKGYDPNYTGPTNTSAPPAPPSVATWIGDGMYKVGKDIPAGEYVVKSVDNWGGYYCVSKDSSGEYDSIINNNTFNNTAYVTVSDGQYLQISSAEFAEESTVAAAVPVNGILPEGMYKVGKDIKAGEYKVRPTDTEEGAYLAVLKNTSDGLDSIVTNDYFYGSRYVTVKDGQYLELSRCELLID